MPPFFTTDSRAWWVTTNTGAWNGGSSPHGTSPVTNMPCPMTTGPNRSIHPASNSSSGPPAPPSAPCIRRKLRSPNTQECSRSPPMPSGCSGPDSGPAMYPSSEMPSRAMTSVMTTSSIGSYPCVERGGTESTHRRHEFPGGVAVV